MLKRLHVKNFTVFADATFEFGPGLNVVVGTNGTGKSHVLKLGYAVLRTSYRARQTFALQNSLALRFTLGESMRALFQTKGIGNLVRFQAQQHESAAVQVELTDESAGAMSFTFERQYATDTESAVLENKISREASDEQPLVTFTSNVPRQFVKLPPVFLPAKEVLTTATGMRKAYEDYETGFDETYYDAWGQLEASPLKTGGEAWRLVQPMVAHLETIMGGQILKVGKSFVFVPSNQKQSLEIDLLAEGLRKLATLAYLLTSGRLRPQTTLFWDEPEANLNPALLRKLAAVLAELARQGFQIVLATHSLFLLKELHIISRQKEAQPLPIRYFGLNAGKDGATTVTAVDDFELLPDIVALDEELEQADKLTLVFAQEDADHHGKGR